MQRIILATANQHKLREFQAIMPERTIISLREIGFRREIPETGTTFEENALLKARAVKEFLRGQHDSDFVVVADDSGLCVSALGGRPGVYTARYGGTDCSPHDQRMLLLKELEGEEDRRTQFECCLVCIFPRDGIMMARGIAKGKITDREYGSGGFAFDPIFWSQELGKTFGEASAAEKDSVSHRGRAVRQLSEHLAALEQK